MPITRLVVDHLRIIKSCDIYPADKFNLIQGSNGAGKTSLLEAVFLLARGHSFRTRQISKLLPDIVKKTNIYAEIVKNEKNVSTIGVSRGTSSSEQKINGVKINTSSELARELAIALLTPQSHLLIEGGPRQRRRLMDWVMFHVEHDALKNIKRYERSLAQRNSAIKNGQEYAQFSIWDRELIEYGNIISIWRKKFTLDIKSIFDQICSDVLGFTLDLQYRQGWNAEYSLELALSENKLKDYQRRFTTAGIHRDDCLLKYQGQPVQHILSRGQSKLLIFALILSMIIYIEKRTEQPVLLLIDDIASELDADHCKKILNSIQQWGGQVFITSAQPVESMMQNIEYKMFHVEQGAIKEIM